MKGDEQAARAYIADMCRQLAVLAEKNHLPMTAHLLEMAQLSIPKEEQVSPVLVKCH